MSHNLTNEDKQQSRVLDWHSLSEVIPGLSLDTPGLWLREWEAKKIELSLTDKTTGEKLTGHKRLYALVTIGKNGTPFFVSEPFADSYRPYTNEQFLKTLGDSLKACGLPNDIRSCGSVRNRRRTFVSVELPQGNFIHGRREFKAYLSFLNSFDKSSPVVVSIGNTCVVCDNTFTWVLLAGGLVIVHSKNSASKILNIPAIVSRALAEQAEFQNDFLKLASVDIKRDNVLALFVAMLVGKDGTLSTRSLNIAERLTALQTDKAKGNDGKTLADVISAVTDFYSHESVLGAKKANFAKQYESSEFGAGGNAKVQAMKYLVQFTPSITTSEIVTPWTTAATPEVTVDTKSPADKMGIEIQRGEKILADYHSSR